MMLALTFPAILSAAGLSAPSLPSPAAASQNSLPDLVTSDDSEPAALPSPSAALTLSDIESSDGVYSPRAHSWATSEWRTDERQGKFDPVIVNVVMTVSDDCSITPHPVPSSNATPNAPSTTSAFRAKKPFCFCCHRLGHIVRDCERQHHRDTQRARCSGGPPPAPAQPTVHWDTHHKAWDSIPPVDQCLNPMARVFCEHCELLRNCLHSTDATINKLLEEQKYWSDRLWEVEWKNPPCPSKEEVRGTRRGWRDEEDQCDPSWGLPGWDF